MEKLKLKYDILQHDADKYLDMIADLKLEVKNKDSKILALESEVRKLKAIMDDIESTAKWAADANENAIAKLSKDVQQKDDRIAQLKELLVQQTEVMQLGNHGEECDVQFNEERVSAV